MDSYRVKEMMNELCGMFCLVFFLVLWDQGFVFFKNIQVLYVHVPTICIRYSKYSNLMTSLSVTLSIIDRPFGFFILIVMMAG